MFSAEFVNGFTGSMSPGRVEIGSLEDPLVNDEGVPLIVLVERRMEIHHSSTQSYALCKFSKRRE